MHYSPCAHRNQMVGAHTCDKGFKKKDMTLKKKHFSWKRYSWSSTNMHPFSVWSCCITLMSQLPPHFKVDICHHVKFHSQWGSDAISTNRQSPFMAQWMPHNRKNKKPVHLTVQVNKYVWKLHYVHTQVRGSQCIAHTRENWVVKTITWG